MMRKKASAKGSVEIPTIGQRGDTQVLMRKCLWHASASSSAGTEGGGCILKVSPVI